jgi:hypothetical protein
MENIKNNFYFSFLAINFVNQRPFAQDVVLPSNMAHSILKAQLINSFDAKSVQEYGNSIRRHFLNDMVIAYERYSMLMFASHNNGQQRIDPSLINDRHLGAASFEQLPNIYQPDEHRFLIQLRRLRNSIVHYNGVYSATNNLDYSFGTQSYLSRGNEGQNISIEFDNILWIYDNLMPIVQNGNREYFSNYTLT